MLTQLPLTTSLSEDNLFQLRSTCDPAAQVVCLIARLGAPLDLQVPVVEIYLRLLQLATRLVA